MKRQIIRNQKHIPEEIRRHPAKLSKIFTLSNDCFPYALKAAEVSPIYKKNDNLDKEN